MVFAAEKGSLQMLGTLKTFGTECVSMFNTNSLEVSARRISATSVVSQPSVYSNA